MGPGQNPATGVHDTAAITTTLTNETVRKGWESFFRKYARTAVDEAVLSDRRSIEVSYWDVDKHDHLLAEHTIEHPRASLEAAGQVLASLEPAMEGAVRLLVRLSDLPEHRRLPVRSLRTVHLGRLIAVEGLVKKATEVRPRLVRAAFLCLNCRQVNWIEEEQRLEFEEPADCTHCGKRPAFRFLEDRSVFVDTQKVEIQEAPETLRGGEQPERLSIYVEDDLCHQCRPGDRIVVNGVLTSQQKKISGQKSNLFDVFLDAVSVEHQVQEFEEVSITPEEEVAIVETARDPDLYDKLTHSLAPSLYGLETEKLALILQLFGGVPKKSPDGVRLRGDIHVLLVGDPGVAKSQLLRYVSRMAPRAIYTSGKGSSAAGLTATAVRDEFGDGRWTLEAGALVLADKGICCVDEIDKMEKQDRSAMHEAMEQQTISIAKAGITAELQSRCALLGAANPKDGRFTEFSSIAEQIDLPPPLLSRFDIIFALQDKPETEKDRVLAAHILEVHHAGAINAYLEHYPTGLFSEEDAAEAELKIKPPLARDFLRKYVAYAKRSCFPVLTAEASSHLQDYYVTIRRQASQEGGPVPMTARQLEALVRIAEASARARLDNEVRVEDATRAIRIVEYWLRRVASGEGGRFDIDIVASGTGHSQRERITTILKRLRELSEAHPTGVPHDELSRACAADGVPDEKLDQTLERLLEQGRIIRPRNGYWRAV